MKKIITALCTVLLLLSLSACTIYKPAEPERTITVSGTGSVTVRPDIVSLTYTIKNQGWWIETAVTNNATATTNVIAALKDCGISESDIQTCDYRITQASSNTNGIDILNGNYIVSNTIVVFFHDISNVGKTIDTVANRIGRNSTTLGISSFEYIVSDKTSALRQARTLAIQNAQDAANLLAGASGCKVSEVKAINENYSSTSSTRYMKAAYMEDSVTTPIEAGTVSITSSVTITYSLE